MWVCASWSLGAQTCTSISSNPRNKWLQNSVNFLFKRQINLNIYPNHLLLQVKWRKGWTNRSAKLRRQLENKDKIIHFPAFTFSSKLWVIWGWCYQFVATKWEGNLLSVSLPSICETEPTASQLWDVQGESALKFPCQGKANSSSALLLPLVWSSELFKPTNYRAQVKSQLQLRNKKLKCRLQCSSRNEGFVALQTGWWWHEKWAKPPWESPVVIMWGWKGCTSQSASVLGGKIPN